MANDNGGGGGSGLHPAAPALLLQLSVKQARGLSGLSAASAHCLHLLDCPPTCPLACLPCRFLEEELARRYRDAAPATLALLQERCEAVAQELISADRKLQEAGDVVSLRRAGGHGGGSLTDMLAGDGFSGKWGSCDGCWGGWAEYGCASCWWLA